MPRTKLYLKHIFASFIFLAILLNTIFLLYTHIKNVVTDPQMYFGNNLTVNEIHIAISLIILIIISVLLSYIFYLLLTFKTRFEMEIWNATKPLTYAKEQFRRLYESAPVPYMLLDKNALISDPNKSALRFFEVLPEEIEGKNLFSFTPPENSEEAEKLFNFYKSNIPLDRKELQMVTKNNKLKTVLVSIFEMKNVNSFSSTGLAMIFDITEQKILDKQKTEFVSLASHQLKTPLATAKWYTEMLISGDIGELQPKQKEYIERLHTANENMVDLVDTLLNVSRIEMGTLVMDKKQTNIEELTESILSELTNEINIKEINVVKNYNNFLQNIKSDPKMLRIVIQNLISNSIKYTPNNGTMYITFQESGIDGNKIIISDNGVGIPKSEQDKIFTKLYRAENVRKLENSQGSGLGLYLVKSIMNSLGGDIIFQSEENEGSIFTIKL